MSPIVTRIVISPTAFEQARGGALGAGGGRVGFAGGGPLLSRPREARRLMSGARRLLSRPNGRGFHGRRARSCAGCVALLVGLDACEVRLCDPCACVRPCVPCVSRLPPVSIYGDARTLGRPRRIERAQR